MSSPLKQLSATEMNRRQFLLHVGAAAFIITGIPAIIRALTDIAPRQHRIGGYGSSSYGGTKPSSRYLK